MAAEKLLAIVKGVLPHAESVTPETLADATNAKGAYALILSLPRPVRFLRKKEQHLLPSGLYLYAGSAWGPGGIRARLKRHFQRQKKLHWHVDQLTTAAETIQALAMDGARECEIIDRLHRLPNFTHPLAKFGSSDCPTCPSHLLRYAPPLGQSHIQIQDV